MTTDSIQLDIRTKSRGAHWISWVTRDGGDAPLDSVILVGRTEAEAEAEARTWAARLVADPVLIRS